MSSSKRIIIRGLLLCCFLFSPYWTFAEVPSYPLTDDVLYIRDWLMCGPFPSEDVSEEIEVPGWLEHKYPNSLQDKRAFLYDFLHEHGGETAIQPTEELEHTLGDEILAWTLISGQHRIDLWNVYGELEHVSCYAYAEIESPEEQTVYLNTRSDDAIRVWLNGEKVHDLWVGRAINQGSDHTKVNLNEGTNHLLLKIINSEVNWGLSCRILHQNQLPLEISLGNQFNFDEDNVKANLWRVFPFLIGLSMIGLLWIGFFIALRILRRSNRI